MRLRADYGIRLIAGAVFGLYMAHLLYFLNPQIFITPLRLAGVALVIALIASLLFGNILWLLHVLRRRWSGGEAERHRGLGLIALAAFLSALIYWGHTILLRVYLPRGAVSNLDKASTIVAAASLVVFLLWLMERNAPRKRSLTLLAAAVGTVLLSSFFLYERRERYHLEAAPPGVAVSQSSQPRRIVLVAVRNLPYDWILQMIGEDLLPFFGQAAEESFVTRINPFPTSSPKTLWASLATGKLPHAHGVTGRFSYRTALNRNDDPFLNVPGWVGFKAWGLVPPVERISAQLPSGGAQPVWKMIQRAGMNAAVINWPGATRQNLSDSTALQAAGEKILDPANAFIAIVLDDLEHLPGDDNELPPQTSPAGETIRRSVEALDRFLSSLQQSNPDATIVVVSPSGPRPPALPATPLQLLKSWVNQEKPGSSDGFLLVAGANAVNRRDPASAVITDVVPTVLFAAGLPVARDMDGRAIAEAFTERFVQENPMTLIPTWED